LLFLLILNSRNAVTSFLLLAAKSNLFSIPLRAYRAVGIRTVMKDSCVKSERDGRRVNGWGSWKRHPARFFAFRTAPIRSLGSQSFVRKSLAPNRIASFLNFLLGKSVRTTTGRSLPVCCNCFKISRPFFPGIFRSSTNTSAFWLSICRKTSSASRASAMTFMSPARLKIFVSALRTSLWSSATMILILLRMEYPSWCHISTHSILGYSDVLSYRILAICNVAKN